MKQYLVATSLALVLSLGWASASAWARPADLPEMDKITCAHGGADSAPGAIDALSPTLVQAWLDRWLQQFAGWLAPQVDPQTRRVRREFDAAERDRRAGAYERARLKYQRVHLLAPTSRLGRLAIDRITQIEQRQREAGEEAEPPAAPQKSDDDLRDRCPPLGLFKLSY